MLKAISRANSQRSSTTHSGTLRYGKEPRPQKTLPKVRRRYSRILARKAAYRRWGPLEILFVSIASTAESFRSTCGSERGAPECSTQRFPAATPHVGHETEDICLGVSSFFFIHSEY